MSGTAVTASAAGNRGTGGRATRTSGTRRVRAVGVAVGVVALVLTGCTSPRNALGTDSSPCFRALAVAPNAIHHEGRFVGVRYVSSARFVTAVHNAAREGPRLPPAVAANKAPVCVVEYRGRFEAGELSREWPPNRTEGPFAVVVLVAKTDKLLATILFDRQALRFAHEL